MRQDAVASPRVAGEDVVVIAVPDGPAAHRASVLQLVLVLIERREVVRRDRPTSIQPFREEPAQNLCCIQNTCTCTCTSNIAPAFTFFFLVHESCTDCACACRRWWERRRCSLVTLDAADARTTDAGARRLVTVVVHSAAHVALAVLAAEVVVLLQVVRPYTSITKRMFQPL